MNKIVTYKTNALTERPPEVPSCVIEISAQLPSFDEVTLQEHKAFYEKEAQALAKSLVSN